MSKTCLRWLQIIEYFYEIYLLECICMYIKNILETKSSTFMKKFPLRDQRKMWYGKIRVTSYVLLATSWKLKSTSWNSKVQVQIQELRVQIHEFNFTSY